MKCDVCQIFKFIRSIRKCDGVFKGVLGLFACVSMSICLRYLYKVCDPFEIKAVRQEDIHLQVV